MVYSIFGVAISVFGIFLLYKIYEKYIYSYSKYSLLEENDDPFEAPNPFAPTIELKETAKKHLQEDEEATAEYTPICLENCVLDDSE